jgi:hypothetical protein
VDRVLFFIQDKDYVLVATTYHFRDRRGAILATFTNQSQMNVSSSVMLMKVMLLLQPTLAACLLQ